MIYVQTSPTGNTLRTAAVDGSGDRELFAALPDDCPSFNRPAWNPTDQTEIAMPCVTAAGTVQVHLLSVDGTEVGTLDTGLPTVDDLTLFPGRRHPGLLGARRHRARTARSSPSPRTAARHRNGSSSPSPAPAMPTRHSPRTAA